MPGRVYLLPQPWGGFAGTERTVGEWVTRVLGEQADVPKKLAEHPEVAERHAFIWATPTSDMAVQTQLEPGDDHPFPMKPPTLPAGVTQRVVGKPLVPRRSGMVSRPRLVADSTDVVIRRSGNLNGPGRLKPVHSCRFALIPANVVDARQ